jgi:metal-dependent amidase/aminoacylase/carboxypeptidase family protein
VCRYPPLINHVKENAIAVEVEVLRNLVGDDSVNTQIEPTMGAEEFAYMLQEKPGCYVFIGNGSGDHREHRYGLRPCNLHNTSYDFNDQLLPIDVSLLSSSGVAFFKQYPTSRYKLNHISYRSSS